MTGGKDLHFLGLTIFFKMNARSAWPMRIIEIEIKNWKKHNPRADVKSCTWFKMSNDFFNDPDFFMLSGDAQRLWIYLLGQASKKLSESVKINTQLAANSLRISIDSIDFALLELVKTGSLNQKPVTLVSSDLASERKEEVVRPLEERREEEKRKEERREEGTNVNPDFLIETWNNTMANKFKFSYCHGFSGEDQKELITTISYKEFNKRDLWLEIYRKTLASEFLNGIKEDFVATPNWLVKHKNALKVLNGQYSGTSNKQKGGKATFKSKGFGVTPTPENPTGNPYTAQRLAKENGEIA